MDESDGLHDPGNISVKNVLTLLVAWILIFACLMKGVKSSGKVKHVTRLRSVVSLESRDGGSEK